MGKMYKDLYFDIVITENIIGKTTKKLEINLHQGKKYRKYIIFGFVVDIYSSKYYNLYSRNINALYIMLYI